MKKIIAITLIIGTFSLVGCRTTDDNQADKDKNSQTMEDNINTPFSTGPTEGPETMSQPTSPPVFETTTDDLGDEVEKISRTHHSIEKEYTDDSGRRKISLTFNIDEGEVKGVMVQPSFTGERRDLYHELTEQIVFKKLDEIGEIKPVDGVPELSKVFSEAFIEAVAIHKEKNNI